MGRQKFPTGSLALLASPYAAVILTALLGPRHPYDGMLESDWVNAILLIWLVSPAPTVAGLWGFIDRRGSGADWRMGITMIIGTIVPLLVIAVLALVVI